MAHKVANFFRSNTGSLDSQSGVKTSNIARTASGRPRAAQRVSSNSGSIEELADGQTEAQYAPLRMPESPRPSPKATHSDHNHHRLSIPSFHLSGKGASKDVQSNNHATLRWKIESPPNIFYGDPENSTGALASGLLFLDVKDDGWEIESFKATLNIHVTQKRPFTQGCKECTNQYTEVKTWQFLPKPTALSKREHGFPFSVLLDGHLPATLDDPLVTIAYEFTATATPKTGASLVLNKTFDVKRALILPEEPHHSIRVFPPTNVKASVEFPQMIHPIGNNTVTMRLDGIAKLNQSVKTVEYWKLKKLTWRLEETCKSIAPACSKHAPETAQQESSPSRKGVQRQDTRLIGEKALFSGWKSQFAGADDSQVEFEFGYHISKHAKFSCDTKSREGSEVSHQLTLEMVISQEYAPLGKPHMITQTGVGRILRMSFPTVLTERGGIGISWDNEQPPIYQDVPPSPPTYNTELAKGVVENIAIPTYLETLDGPSGAGVAGPSGAAGGASSSTESLQSPAPAIVRDRLSSV